MDDITELLQDPRPDLGDTRLWHHLFRLIYKSDMDKLRALKLHRMLYTVRAVGTNLIITLDGARLSPIRAPDGHWHVGDSTIMHEQLAPYMDDLRMLYDQLRQINYDEMDRRQSG